MKKKQPAWPPRAMESDNRWLWDCNKNQNLWGTWTDRSRSAYRPQRNRP